VAVADTAGVTVWFDPICPWAYLGRDRTDILVDLGFTVVERPYELHPTPAGTPPRTRPIRPGGRLDRLHREIAVLCAACGVPFRPPTTVTSTRWALELTEVVRAHDPGSHAAVVADLFTARFVDDVDLGDPHAVADRLTALGLDTARLMARTGAGDGTDRVDRSMDEARALGITATPGWAFPTGFVLTGVHDREQMARWGRRLLGRSSGGRPST